MSGIGKSGQPGGFEDGNCSEKDVDVLLRSDQKLLPGNKGPERNLLGWGAGPRTSHLPEGDETCEGLPPLQRAAPGTQSRERCSFPQGCQRTKCWKMILVKALSRSLYHTHSCKINWNISFCKKKTQSWPCGSVSLDQGREVVVVMKMIMTKEAFLTQNDLCSHTCLFVEALFENPGLWLRLDLTKLWLLKVVFSQAAVPVHCWRNKKQMKRGHRLVTTSNYRK